MKIIIIICLIVIVSTGDCGNVLLPNILRSQNIIYNIPRLGEYPVNINYYQQPIYSLPSNSIYGNPGIFGSPIYQQYPGNTVCQNPGFGNQNPVFGSQNPVFGSQNPGFGSQNPVFGSQNPGFVSQNPVFGSQNPVFGSQIPVFGTQTPGQRPIGVPAPAPPPPPSQIPSGSQGDLPTGAVVDDDTVSVESA